MKKYKNKPFFKLFFRFGITFLLVVVILKMIITAVKNASVSEMFSLYFSAENWQKFATEILVMSLFYGLFMTGYYKFIKK